MWGIVRKADLAVVATGDKGPAKLPGGRRLVNTVPTPMLWEDDEFIILPFVDVDPPFDLATQLRSGPVVTVDLKAKVINRVWTVTDRPAADLAAELDARRELAVTGADLVLATAMFQLAKAGNVTSINGQAIDTPAGFKKWLRKIADNVIS